ncbi:MAG: undecaprenyldiphospho-muramoylpentapeptide beta-N-acetylglucosaminyltransferase [Cetobacterium sp.]|uniref:undecaprenyldiphospho-muramoylpentapeptide beta-N-acetylglucosaminyltransferase n=1 Tax=unclassified Cetobacterium TaxID=2630983 RepID=UPI00163C4FD9|nr:undecaprenyldiphospho-muramoylpentapeptide beta-N-acetylglucosaminyltransferase [Cetobacterium sp. 2A]MBC2856116.1 undecaprenyldiphospho-muramoylpentapeptide beta-N-acetylglucosaminyltransferase [Cetobacterium sp. 2A]
MKKIILTTGGTGGHIYPALAVAEGLRKKNMDILFVGSSTRMEKDIVPEEGYRFIGLDIFPPKSIKNIFKSIKAMFKAFKIVLDEKPDVIIGFGNYISVPVLLAGVVLRKKIYLQEQNANLGMTNKIFYKFAKKSFLAFDKTYDDIPMKYQHKFSVTGNPLREEIYSVHEREERERLKLSDDEKLLLITGGSLGAKDINEAVLQNWETIFDDKRIRVYWATGESNFDEINKRTANKKIKVSDIIKPYFNNMINIMSAADLVICRAGALTISEIVELEKPAILIPYNSIKVGQYENAKILEENKAALIYSNSDAVLAMERALELIRDEDRLKKMKVRVKGLKKANAVEKIISNLDIWRN